MPPNLAAVLCFGYIFWLLYMSSREPSRVSRASWLVTLWVGILASKPIAGWINAAGNVNGVGLDVSAAEGSPVDRNVLILMLVCAMVILAKRGFSWATFVRDNKWLVAFHVFTLVSCIWSDYTFVAFKRWIRDVGNVLMILVLLTEDDPVQAIRLVFVRCAYVLLPLSILVIKYFVDIGLYYDPWNYVSLNRGITTDKNALGRLAWVSGLFLVWSLDNPKFATWFKKVKSRWWELTALSFCILVLTKSNSATSLVCFTAALFVGFVARMKKIRRSRKLMISGALTFILLTFLFLGIPDLRQAFTKMLGRKPDLTERTDVWAGALALKTNPLIGTGFASFWLTPGAQEMGLRMQLSEAHNGYLETYLSTGIIGCVLLLGVLISAGRNALRYIGLNSPIGNLFAASLLAGILYNYTESAYNNSSFVGFLIWQVAVWYRPPARAPAPQPVARAVPARRATPAPRPA